MRKLFRLATALILSATLFGTTSCQKEEDEKIIPLEQQLLTAKTWQVEEVIETHDGASIITYKKGAPDNIDDFSMIRQSFKTNGSITYVDSFGEKGTNGRYQLLGNNQMQLSVGGLSTIVNAVVIRENSFSYQQPVQDGTLQFTFSPVP